MAAVHVHHTAAHYLPANTHGQINPVDGQLFQPGHREEVAHRQSNLADMMDAYGEEIAHCWQTNLPSGHGSVGEVAGGGMSCVGVVVPPTSGANLPHINGGTSFDAAPQQLVSHKRKRDQHSPALDAVVLASHVQQQHMEIDRLVLNHKKKIHATLLEQTQRNMKLMRIYVEAKAAKQLQDKDKEIQKAIRINWLLEERLNCFCNEAQNWCEIARSHEAAANALRCELEQVRETQARQLADGVADDAESCCHGENDVSFRGEDEITNALKRPRTTSSNHICKGCGEFVAEVLLLPCRHLCACVSCAATVLVCPVCGCVKNGTIDVKF